MEFPSDPTEWLSLIVVTISAVSMTILLWLVLT
jgi:hypothetical protein